MVQHCCRSLLIFSEGPASVMTCHVLHCTSDIRAAGFGLIWSTCWGRIGFSMKGGFKGPFARGGGRSRAIRRAQLENAVKGPHIVAAYCCLHLALLSSTNGDSQNAALELTRTNPRDAQR